MFYLTIYTAAYVDCWENIGYSVSPLELGSTMMKWISNTAFNRSS